MLFYVLNFSAFLYSRFLFMLSLALQVIHLGNSKKHFIYLQSSIFYCVFASQLFSVL